MPIRDSGARYNVIAQLVKDKNWTRGAELGVLRGSTLFYLLDNCPSLVMVGVDRWQAYPELEKHDQDTMDFFAGAVKAKAKRYDSRCIILHGDSVEMAEFVPDGSLDFVFIDGDHSEDGCARDIAAWRSKVHTGGMMMGHDINWRTVRNAVESALGPFVMYPDNVWAVGC
jgi:predicted O-methyltransferase YrrM